MCSSTIISFFSQWRLWIRPVLVALYVILIIVLVPILIAHSIQNGFSKSDQGSLVGGGFVLLALPISIWQITQHVVHYTKPSLQKHIIRILWMVPIYALNAWIGLEFPEQSIYVDSLRECYEAYVIYNFMKYLLNYLNEDHDLEALLETKPQVYHIFPLCCLTPWEMGSEFVHNCKHGILQYTVVRPITTVISMICELSGVYGESDFSPNVAFPYIVAINNLSQFVAMYCLVLFYRANKTELKPMKPIGKFLCIKAVVFFSFFMCRSTVEKEEVFLNQNSAGGNNDAALKDIGGHVERLSTVTLIILVVLAGLVIYFILRLYKNCHRSWIQEEIGLSAMQRIRASIRGRVEVVEAKMEFDLKVACSLIPVLDGDVETTKRLIDSVEMYANMLDGKGEAFLITFVLKNRLSENAKLRLSSSYNNVKSLIIDIKQHLLPKKSSVAVQTQLYNIQQGSRSIEAYGTEIENLFTELTISQADGDSDTFKILKPINEKFAIKRFSDGLRSSKLGTIISARNYTNLKDAIQAAKDEDTTSFQSSTGNILHVSKNRHSSHRMNRSWGNYQRGNCRGQYSNNNFRGQQSSNDNFRGRVLRGSNFYRSSNRSPSMRQRGFRGSRYFRNQTQRQMFSAEKTDAETDTKSNIDTKSQFFRF